MRGYKTKDNMMQDASYDHNQKIPCNNKNQKGGSTKYFLFIVLLIVLLIVAYNLHKDQPSTPEQSNEEYVSNDTILNGEDSIQNNEVNEANEKKEQLTGVHNGHEWVDLGLSVKWATCNIGASTPWEYGNFFAWGEVKPKAFFSEENYSEPILDDYDIAGSNNDAAHIRWGGAWRLPKSGEFEELIEKCSFKWSTFHNKNGWFVTGPNGKKIFFPAAGYASEKLSQNSDTWGSYLSSSIDQYDVSKIYDFEFNESKYGKGYGFRESGHTIRAVFEK